MKPQSPQRSSFHPRVGEKEITAHDHGAEKAHSKLHRKLIAIMRQHSHRSADGSKNVSFETKEKRSQLIFGAFDDLRQLGYKLQDPENLRVKHIQALGHYWEKEGKSASTIQQYLSALRVFCTWIGKEGMIRKPEEYVADPKSVQRSYIPKTDKSWCALGVDYQEIASRVAEIEPRVGVYLKLAVIFGLRRNECISLQPHKADHGDYLLVESGTKGGRLRKIDIRTPEQRALLEECKKLTPNLNGHIGIPGYSKKEMLNRFDTVMRSAGITKSEMGITMHGLRHQYANDRLSELGVTSPVRGGDLRQQKIDNPELVEEARKTVAEELGHGRVQITATYAGGFVRTELDQPGE